MSYYIATAANDVVIAGRFFPRGELNLIIEDKVMIATRKFGRKVSGQARGAAVAFLDAMIESGGWSTKQSDFGGSMHQFQPDAYRKTLKALQADDPVVQQAKDKGPEFWTAKFEALAGGVTPRVFTLSIGVPVHAQTH